MGITGLKTLWNHSKAAHEGQDSASMVGLHLLLSSEPLSLQVKGLKSGDLMIETFQGKEGIWIYSPSYDSLPNERVLKVYRRKEDWFPIWEEMCEKFVEQSTARWQKGFETQLRQARNDYPNLSDEELKREVLHFDYWLSKYEEAPVRARDSVVGRTEEGDEMGFYDIGSYGSFTFVPFEDMPWVRLRAEEFGAEGEGMSLKESAKVGFGLGAGLLGFRIVALTGAVALGALLNRR